jgi:capsular polysaccharide transport system ATP-binding protein
MIIVDNVHKRYHTDRGPGPWVLQGVNFAIPRNISVGLIGANGAGKSTLLRIIGGVDRPNKGHVERHCRVSWPMGFGGGLQGSLTGRQNAKFVCRVHGHESDIPERIAFIEDFAEIGDAIDEPVKTYSSGMRSRLHFGMSLAFDFDVYISDEVTSNTRCNSCRSSRDVEWYLEVFFEEQLQIDAVREIDRFFEMKHRCVLLAVAAEELPAAGHFLVEGGAGVVAASGFAGGFAFCIGLV